MEENKKEKFSYSKLDTMKSCGWQYKLKYIDKNFVYTNSIATDFGTLVHYIEETIAKDIMANNDEPYFMIDTNKYIDLFINADIQEDGDNVLGIKKLKEQYPDDFYIRDKSGMNYSEKANDYLNFGIYRLQDYLAQNRHLKIIATEQRFEFLHEGYVFYGFIDRVFRNTIDNSIIVEDIKTWYSIDQRDVITPLQFVIYTLACQQLYNTDNITCAYDLPLAKNRYSAGTKGFIKRGIKKINELLQAIERNEFIPNPKALCRWCPFSITNPDHIDKPEALCPYHSNWTMTDRKRQFEPGWVDYNWSDIENHTKIQEHFLNKIKNVLDPITLPSKVSKVFNTEDMFNKRIFIGKRD